MAKLTLSGWKNRPEAILQVVFWVHFLFSSWSHLGFWSGNKLIFQDAFFLLAIMWAMHTVRSPCPVILAIGINLLSIILDIIVLAVSFPSRSSTEEFSAVMAIFNLVLRVLSTILLVKNLENRDDLDAVDGSHVQNNANNNNITLSDGGRPSSRASRTGSFNGIHIGSFDPNPSKQPPLPPIPHSYTQHQ